jgi:methylated-DNA-protein-cysteine methyltransferase-like protein
VSDGDHVEEGSGFKQRVFDYVSAIPSGRVMTYGQIAALCGSPRAARIVGGIAHYGPEELPWHRVVNKKGGLAKSFPGGRAEQARLLSLEGVEVDTEYAIHIDSYLWWPE